jgi:hypothetical protein
MRFGQNLVLAALFISPAIADDAIIQPPNAPAEPLYEASRLSRDARQDLQAAGREERAADTAAGRGDYRGVARAEQNAKRDLQDARRDIDRNR